MTAEEILEALLQFGEDLKIAKSWTSMLRDVGLSILRGMGWIVDSLGSGLKSTYKLMNFYDSPQVEAFINPYLPVIWAFMILAVVLYGIKIMHDGKNEAPTVINNFIIGIALFFALPWCMSQGVKLVDAGVGLLNVEKSSSLTVYQNNITDLYTIDKNGWVYTGKNNDLKKKESLSYLDISETVDTKGSWFEDSPLSDKGQDILSKKVIELYGEPTAVKLTKPVFTSDEEYYRYSWHPFFMFVEFVVKAMVYGFAIFKTARIMMELGIFKIFVKATSLLDISSGKRNKQMIDTIKNSFIVLYMISFLITCFDLWCAYVGQSGIDKPVQMVAVIAGGMLVIDGPNFIEQMFGIDAGLSSVSRGITGLVQGGYGVSKGFSGISKGIKASAGLTAGVAKNAGKGALFAGAAGKGALDGFKAGIPGGSEGDSPIPKNEGGNNNKPDPNKPKDGGTPPTNPNTEGNKPNQENGNKEEPSNQKAESKGNGYDPMMSPSFNSPLANKKPNEEEEEEEEKKNTETPPPSTTKATSIANQANNKLKNTPLSKKVESKSKDALNGDSKQIKAPSHVGGNKLPEQVNQARNNLNEGMKPREVDTDTIGGKAINQYANLAQKVSNSSTARTTRKIYDVSKATSQNIFEKGDKK